MRTAVGISCLAIVALAIDTARADIHEIPSQPEPMQHKVSGLDSGWQGPGGNATGTNSFPAALGNLSLGSGKTWTVQGSNSSAVIGNGRLVVLSEVPGGAGTRMGGYDLETGKEVWTFDVSSVRPFGRLYYAEGNVFCAIRNSIGHDLGLIAVDVQSGKEKWKLDSADIRSSAYVLSPRGMVVVGKEVNLYDFKTGKPKWKKPPAWQYASPWWSFADEGQCYLGWHSGIRVIELANGKDNGERSISGGYYQAHRNPVWDDLGAPQHEGDSRLWFMSDKKLWAPRGHFLTCYNLDKKSVVAFSVGSYQGGAKDGNELIVNDGGVLKILIAETLAHTRTIALGEPLVGAPVVTKDWIFAGSKSHLYMIARDGSNRCLEAPCGGAPMLTPAGVVLYRRESTSSDTSTDYYDFLPFSAGKPSPGQVTASPPVAFGAGDKDYPFSGDFGRSGTTSLLNPWLPGKLAGKKLGQAWQLSAPIEATLPDGQNLGHVVVVGGVLCTNEYEDGGKWLTGRAVKDGQVLWRRPWTGKLPIAHSGRLFYAGKVGSHPAGVWCLDAATGEVLWARFCTQLDEQFAIIDGRPHVAGDTFEASFDAATGNTVDWIWRDQSTRVHGGITTGNLHFTLINGKLACFEPLTNKLRWEVAHEGNSLATPCVFADGRLFLPGKKQVIAYDVKDGSSGLAVECDNAQAMAVTTTRLLVLGTRGIMAWDKKTGAPDEAFNAVFADRAKLQVLGGGITMIAGDDHLVLSGTKCTRAYGFDGSVMFEVKGLARAYAGGGAIYLVELDPSNRPDAPKPIKVTAYTVK